MREPSHLSSFDFETMRPRAAPAAIHSATKILPKAKSSTQLVLYCHQDAQAKETCQIITIETTEGVEAIDEIATIEITTGAAADQEGRGQDQDRGQDLRATIIPVAFHQLA